MKKILLSCTLCLCLLLPGAWGSTAAAPRPYEGVTLTMMGWHEEVPAFWADFEAETGIKIEYSILPSDQYASILSMRFAAGELPDVFAPRYFDTYEEMAAAGALLDLTAYDFLDLYTDTALTQLTAGDGRVYAITEALALLCMFYNKTLFDQLGLAPPTDYMDWMDTCQALLDAGHVPYVQGMRELWQCKYVGMDPMYRMSVTDPRYSAKLLRGERRFDIPEVLEAYRLTEQFIQAGYIHENTLLMTCDDAWERFCAGEAAMMSGGSWYNGQTSVRLEDIDAFEVAVAPIPLNLPGEDPFVIVSAISDMYCINAKSKNIGAAVEWLRWWSEHMAEYATHSRHLVATKDARIADVSAKSYIFEDLSAYREVIFQKEPSAISVEYGKVIQNLMLGTMTPEEITAHLQACIEAYAHPPET